MTLTKAGLGQAFISLDRNEEIRSLLASDLEWSGKAVYLAARWSASRWTARLDRRIDSYTVRWKSGASVVLRSGTTDVLVFREIFLEDVYKPAITALALTGHGLRVLDCGANIGLFPVQCANCFDNPSVACIEPDSGNLETLRANVAGLTVEVQSIRAFVGVRDGHGYLEDCGSGEWGFKLSHTHVPGTKPIPVLTVPSVLRSVGWDQVDLLKMDIEGTEAEVFADCLEWIDSVRSIIVEIHPPYTIQRFTNDISQRGRQW